MPFCGECGTQYESGSQFCPNCGARTEAPAQQASQTQQAASAYAYSDPFAQNAKAKPGKSGNLKRLLPILLGALAVVALIVILILTGAFQSKTAKFKAIQKEFLFDSLAAYAGKAIGMVSEPDFRFSDTLTLSGKVTGTGDDETVNSYLTDSALEIKANIDAAKKSYEYELNFVIQDNPLLSAQILEHGDECTLYVPALDEEVYTFSLADLAESLASVNPAVASGMQLDMTSVYGGLTETQVKELVNRYAEILLSIVNKDNLTVRNETVELFDSGETVKCKVYTLAPKEKDYIAMFERMYEAAQDDEDLKTLAFAYYKLESISAGTLDADLDKAFDTFWDDTLDMFDERMEDWAERMVEMGMTWQTAVKGSRVHMQYLYSEEDESGIRYESFGATLKARQDALLFLEDGDDPFITARNEYTVSGKEADGKFEMEADDVYSEVECSFSYTLDAAKKSSLGLPYGKYTLKYPDKGMKMTVEVGEGDGEGDNHAIDLTAADVRIKLDLASAGEEAEIDVPGGSGTDISDYTPDELSALVQKWGEQLIMLLMEVFPELM